MSFSIRQQVFGKDGIAIENRARKYQDELLQLFAESPEWQVLTEDMPSGGWASLMLDFGINYLAVTPPQMSPETLLEILLETFPRKVSAPADEAPNIIRELRAFWQFLQRQFHLDNAAACLKVLDSRTARELKKEMNNPANFGMAKSIMMMGIQRGFDFSSDESMNKWVETYNAELTAGRGSPIPLPGELNYDAQQYRNKVQLGRSGRLRRTDRKRKKY